MNQMKTIVITLVLILGISNQRAAAQIELDATGNVSIGSGAVSADKKLYIRYNNTDSDTKVLHSEFTGGAYQASAIWGSAEAAAGFGYGGTFYGGYKGVRGFADIDTGSGTRNGVFGYAKGGDYNYGLYGQAIGGSGAVNAIGVYGKATGNGTLYAGYFNGSILVTGSVLPSDEKFKEGIRPLVGQTIVDKVRLLNPVNYTYVTDTGLNFPRGEQYGLIAQELEQVFPDLVQTELFVDVIEPEEGKSNLPIIKEETFKSINYNGLIPILLQAIQEQQAEIEALKSALSANGIEVDR